MLFARTFQEKYEGKEDASNATCSALGGKSPCHCLTEVETVAAGPLASKRLLAGKLSYPDVLAQYHTD